MAGEREKIKGAKELMLKLRTLDAKVSDKILRQAMRRACRPILSDAEALVPVLTGALQASLAIHSGAGKKRAWASVRAGKHGFYKGDTFYGGFIEYGFMHEGAQAGAGGLARIGQKLKGGFFVPAHPFLRPAFDKNKYAARDEVTVLVRLAISEMEVRGVPK